VLAVALVVPLGAQIKLPSPAATDPLSKASPVANQAWLTLLNSFSNGGATPGSNQQDSAATNTPASLATAALARADLAKAFYQAYPTHPDATAARKLEILALLDADTGSTPAVSARLSSTELAFRHDTTVSEADRAIVAGFYDFRQAVKSPDTTGSPLTAIEQAARGLVTEFPQQPQGYESLLTLAAQKGNPRGLIIAQGLISSAGSASVKQRAQSLVTRLGLKGRKLSDVVPALAATQPAGTGKLTIVYSWSIQSPSSLAMAKLLGQRPTDHGLWIGVNLDAKSALASAEKIAADGKFPGQQVYDDQGANGTVAKAFGFDSAPLALFVGSDGVIVDVYDAQVLLNTLPYFGL
jgi:hypothetical protein